MSSDSQPRLRRIAQAVLDQQPALRREQENGQQQRIEFAEQKLDAFKQLLLEEERAGRAPGT